jgi:hypothetical protein
MMLDEPSVLDQTRSWKRSMLAVSMAALLGIVITLITSSDRMTVALSNTFVGPVVSPVGLEPTTYESKGRSGYALC